MRTTTASLVMLLAGCGGAPFATTTAVEGVEARDASTDALEPDVLERGDNWTSSTPDVLERPDVLQVDAGLLQVDAEPPAADSTADAAAADSTTDVVGLELDTGTKDEPPPSPCPPAGCRCESAGDPCPQNLPYTCSGGAECCNWRPPGC